MVTLRQRRRFWWQMFAAFFGAALSYATVMAVLLAAKGDGPSLHESNTCSSCHSTTGIDMLTGQPVQLQFSAPQSNFMSIVGGSYHSFGNGDGSGHADFGGVMSGFRM